jgi:hypothetical protein
VTAPVSRSEVPRGRRTPGTRLELTRANAAMAPASSVANDGVAFGRTAHQGVLTANGPMPPRNSSPRVTIALTVRPIAPV